MDNDQVLFLNHLHLAHHFWNKHLKPRDWAIDATCGNGHDALFLSSKVEKLFCIDIQSAAIENTRKKVPTALFFQTCHSQLPREALSPNLKLIVYNLGYLPGSDKSLTTSHLTTKQSLELALSILPVGGAISITFYPGHHEGFREFETLRPFLKRLDSKSFSVSIHEWINRLSSPILAFILKIK